jgi:hypothetical protein
MIKIHKVRSTLDQHRKETESYKKVTKILLIVLIPISLLYLMTLFIPKKHSSKNSMAALLSVYKLEKDFALADITRIVDHMRKDKEFSFYFSVIPNVRIQEITREVFQLLVKNNSQEAIFNTMTDLKSKIYAISSLFYHMDYSNYSPQDPNRNEDLDKLFWGFLEEEFELAVLGVCYKANYNPQFVYEWDISAIQAAEKLKAILSKIPEGSLAL